MHLAAAICRAGPHCRRAVGGGGATAGQGRRAGAHHRTAEQATVRPKVRKAAAPRRSAQEARRCGQDYARGPQEEACRRPQMEGRAASRGPRFAGARQFAAVPPMPLRAVHPGDPGRVVQHRTGARAAQAHPPRHPARQVQVRLHGRYGATAGAGRRQGHVRAGAGSRHRGQEVLRLAGDRAHFDSVSAHGFAAVAQHGAGLVPHGGAHRRTDVRLAGGADPLS